jgi:hypothetical protein
MALKRVIFLGCSIGLVIAGCISSAVYAQSLQSSNYRFDESVIGTGGLLEASSANFSATSATGDIGIGNSASVNFQTNSGTKTSPDPALAFAVLSSSVDFGTLSPSTTSTGTTTFAVSNYTTFGYVVQIHGNAPTNGAHSIDAMSTTTTSQIGVEQFGINLVANTSPTSFGANPDNGQFGFGSITANYATANNYRYVDGETVAQATKNSGVTTYTISYVTNVATLTPGGQYSADQTIIVTGTY